MILSIVYFCSHFNCVLPTHCVFHLCYPSVRFASSHLPLGAYSQIILEIPGHPTKLHSVNSMKTLWHCEYKTPLQLLSYVVNFVMTIVYISHGFEGDILLMSHGFDGDILKFLPRWDTKALARFVTRRRRQRVTNAPRLSWHLESNILV